MGRDEKSEEVVNSTKPEKYEKPKKSEELENPKKPKRKETKVQNVSLVKKESEKKEWKFLVQVNTDSLLSQFRIQLEEKKLMVDTDVFTFENAEVVRAEEQKIKVSTLLQKKSEIRLKPKEKPQESVITPGKAKTPEIHSADLTSTLPEVEED